MDVLSEPEDMLEEADEGQSVDGVELSHQRVRDAILRGELAPGEELSQVDLAKRLSLSRTPLREALRMLQREGLIEAERHRRVRIAPFSLDELEQLYAMRVLLESFAIRQTVPLLTPAELSELDGLLVTMDELAARDDVESWEAPHHRFHERLSQHAGARIVATIEELADHTERYRRVYVTHGPSSWTVGAQEHAQIVEACHAGEGQLASERLARHLSRTALTVIMLAAPEHEPAVVRAALRSVLRGSTETPAASLGALPPR